MLLGCSFAGLEFLYRHARRGGQFRPGEMTIIDPLPRHCYVPLAHEVASGVRRADDLLFDTPIFAAAIGAEWISGTARFLDPAKRVVTLDDGRTVAYDRCVIAVGSVPDVPPAATASGIMIGAKWVDDAVAVRERLVARRAAGAPMARVVVVGGGITAVEWSAELASAAFSPMRVEVTLVGAATRLMPAFDREIGERARRALDRLGVELRLDRRVTGASASAAVAADGEAFLADVVIWAGGVRPNPLLGALDLPVGADGRVIVSPRLNVPGAPGVYVIGDAAQIVENGSTWPTMRRAIEAIWQGATLARRFTNGYEDDHGPNHPLRTDFWYGLSLGANNSAVLKGPRTTESAMFVRGRRWLQGAYYRRFDLLG